MIDAARYFALFETTTRLQATEENLRTWSHHWVGNVWKYSKIAGNGGKFKLLKTPVILPCINMIAGQQGEISKSLTPPGILKCIKIQQDCRQPVNFDYWSHQIFCNVWQYNRIAGNGGKFQSLRPPVLLPGVKIEQNSRLIKLLKATVAASFFAMYENTTKLYAVTVDYWSHEIFCNVWKYNKIAGNRRKI